MNYFVLTYLNASDNTGEEATTEGRKDTMAMVPIWRTRGSKIDYFTNLAASSVVLSDHESQLVI